MKVLYSGEANHYMDFCQRYEMQPADVPLVHDPDHLRGFKDCLFVTGFGMEWIENDRILKSYCWNHNITIMSEREFAQKYSEGEFNAA